ncbi:hypothetical protein M569_10757, partial [Genlisea aurea]
VEALMDLYRSLNSSSLLDNWRKEGGDPCQEAWKGVQCLESSIIEIQLQGLGLTGNIEIQFSNFRNLKHLDLSLNNIQGPIPESLPPNVTHLNLAGNRLNQSIPYSLENLKHLHHLNLSHNCLCGSLGDVFKGLVNLKQMDLSFNNFTGDLPLSFTYLTNVTRLFLQSNQFTGSVIFLANLSITELNIEDNHFSGVIPEKFQNIPNLRFGGNKFDRETNYPPWIFPSEMIPYFQNISTPPATNLSAFRSHPSQRPKRITDNKRSKAAALFGAVVGVAMAAAFLALAVVLNRKKLRGSLRCREESMISLPVDEVQDADHVSMASNDSPNVSALGSFLVTTPAHLSNPLTRKTKQTKFSTSNATIGAKAYTVEELREATASFSASNLLGNGSLGSVYRAEFPDGKIRAVKDIKTVPLSIIEERRFLDVIKTAAHLRHPNIVTLIGYCVEQGQHFIVYEYIRNFSLDKALHRSGMSIPWATRLRIALGIARALDHMHSSCVPPIAHSNLKSANVLLDEELAPRVCDCGLSALRPLSTNTVKLKASEMAISDRGYIGPEHVQPGHANTKADVYAFGVLLLELLTRRKPFDISKPKAEQSLVGWASSRLHDTASLRQMVDPSITRTVTSKSLSYFADIVSVCIQSEQEFRPPMCEVVGSLISLLQKLGVIHEADADPFDPSFRSSHTQMFGSPTASFYSV